MLPNLYSLQRDLLHMNTQLIERLDSIVDRLDKLLSIEVDRDARMADQRVADFYGDGR